MDMHIQSFQLSALLEFSGPDRPPFEVDNGLEAPTIMFLRVTQVFRCPSPACASLADMVSFACRAAL